MTPSAVTTVRPMTTSIAPPKSSRATIAEE
jgi:hypothetical protein